MFPPLPNWDGIHPLLVHFPIALLLVAPLFVLLAALIPRQRCGFGLAALLLMTLGTIGAYVAVATGEAGADLVLRTPEIDVVLERHEEGAESARLLFTIMTLAYAVLLLVPMWRKTEWKPVLRLTLHGVYLVVYAAGMLLLINAAHDGGLLVHRLGVQAMLPAETILPADATAPAGVPDEEEQE